MLVIAAAYLHRMRMRPFIIHVVAMMVAFLVLTRLQGLATDHDAALYGVVDAEGVCIPDFGLFLRPGGDGDGLASLWY